MSADAGIAKSANPTPQLSECSIETFDDGVSRYTYDRNATNIGIVHLGPGAFHRAHQAYYTDEMMNRVGGHWGICEVSLQSSGTRDRLKPQDNLYTLCELGAEKSYRIIGAIKEFLVAGDDIQKVIDRIAQSSVKVVSLTITEKGYCLTGDGRLDLSHPSILLDLATPSSPESAIGVIVEGLRVRRDRNVEPATLLSCDNLTDNGLQLRNAVIDYANAIDPILSKWIAANVPFPSTMVDSITPATSDETIELVTQATGVSDAAPIQREPFTQWIIEDIPGVTLPPWDVAGAQFVPDVRPFEIAKHRILNGLHTSAAFLGLYAGLETVEQAVKHRHIRRFLEQLCVDEIIPTLPDCPGMDLNAYAADVFERFENPGLRHELQQIAWDTSKKLPYRIFNSLADNMEASRSTKGLSTVIATWLVVIQRRICDGKEVVDPLSLRLSKFLAPTLALSSDNVAEILQLCELPSDFSFSEKLANDVSNLVGDLQNHHPEAFLESLV